MSGAATADSISVPDVERRVFRASIGLGIALAASALVLGLVSGTRVLVFDGAFGSIGILVSWVSLKVSAAVAQGPTKRFPFGLQALTPLIVVVQGVASAATILYAAFDAVIVITNGGKPVDASLVAVYSAASTIASFVFVWWINRHARVSDLVGAEAIAWRSGAIRGLVMTIGALAAVVLATLSFTVILDYIDPILVLVSCALVAPLPWRLLRYGVLELLEAAPEPTIAARIDEVIAEVGGRFGLGESVVRSAKLGGRLYVEATFLVGAGTWSVDDEDSVRRAIIDGLRSTGLDLWATIEITADPELLD
ncbi:MAG TPA: cation transporter [Rhodoglobus sp.]|jgi:predicted Co/Zn/Cd cation transporter (cation efflux family)|nr:cation transporter [Rhodoglobus sp.]HPM50840.1 cation transporter [Rhodoglobus sp.]